ncbi:Lrp/AsnC family transcriptional regulator [Streptacidiphilus jiangxiensis]|uniref:DNA-binding transcriptional regulator, Lrp family n=1 Tax=Streptacidiphilus jiangxiensis TaxID=235985 RepID=A0A1H7JVT9_STRJI|nr:AsnC family transcriptional regulator [Streptacidiphilus jiangxiensis]SEK77695.1 DNA-binding transcriptional regulator, Lrp family [Streptacidiphilus jiangxiensis]
MESDIRSRADAKARAFDPLDRQLIQALQLDGRAPFSRLAQVLGVSDQTVARRYARLRESSGLRVLGLTTPEAFGEVRWMIRVQCAPAAAGGLAEALARRDDTAWVNVCSGGAEITCTARAHPDRQDDLLLQRLPRTPSVVGIAAHCVLHTFFGGEQSLALKSGALDAEQVTQVRAFSGAPESGTGTRPGGAARPADPIDLDEGDRQLFAALAVDGRAGFAELAAATGWSASTVRRRMEELEHARALYFDLDLDWRLFGVHAMTQLWLDVAPAELAATGEALAAHPEIGYAAAVTGPSNLNAVVLSPDVPALYTYLTTRIATLPAVRRVESSPVMRTVKGPGPFVTPVRSPRPRRRAGS